MRKNKLLGIGIAVLMIMLSISVVADKTMAVRISRTPRVEQARQVLIVIRTGDPAIDTIPEFWSHTEKWTHALYLGDFGDDVYSCWFPPGCYDSGFHDEENQQSTYYDWYWEHYYPYEEWNVVMMND